jgi:hypothetical protein
VSTCQRHNEFGELILLHVLGSFSRGTPDLKELLASFGFVSGGYPQNKGLIGFVWVRFLS